MTIHRPLVAMVSTALLCTAVSNVARAQAATSGGGASSSSEHPALACLVWVSAQGATASNYRNDCDHDVAVIKAGVSAGLRMCHAASMKKGVTWLLTSQDKVCTTPLQPDDTACDCPAGSEIDLGKSPRVQATRAIQDASPQERKEVEAACIANDRQSHLLSCGCLADAVGTMRGAGSTGPWQNLVLTAADKCPAARSTISDYTFVSCDDYMKDRRTDHEQFCRCSGDKTADDFIAKPDHKLSAFENIRRQSLVACGIANKSTQ